MVAGSRLLKLLFINEYIKSGQIVPEAMELSVFGVPIVEGQIKNMLMAQKRLMQLP